MRIFTPEEEKDICDSYLAEESFPSLEARYGEFYTTINDVLTKHGIPHRRVGYLKQVLKGKETEVVDKYVGGMSIRDLALEYEVDRTVINRIICQSGTPFRATSKSNVKKVYDKEQIRSRYEAGESASSIARKVGVCCSTVMKELKRIGIYKQTKSLPGRPTDIPEELMTKMIDEYINDGVSLCYLIKKYKIGSGHSGLSKFFKRRGVQIRAGTVQNKKYFCTSDFFADPHSPEKYFILGVISTDGYVNEAKGFLNIELHQQDAALLEWIKETLKFTGPLRFVEKKHSVVLNINDDRLVKDLVGLGIHQNKSLTLRPMIWLKDELLAHFVAGVITGDGWVSCRCPNKKYKSKFLSIGFCGSSPFVIWLAEQIKRVLDIKLNYSTAYKNHRFNTSRSDSLRLASLIFRADMPFKLQRKYEHYLQYVEYSKTKELHEA